MDSLWYAMILFVLGAGRTFFAALTSSTRIRQMAAKQRNGREALTALPSGSGAWRIGSGVREVMSLYVTTAGRIVPTSATTGPVRS